MQAISQDTVKEIRARRAHMEEAFRKEIAALAELTDALQTSYAAFQLASTRWESAREQSNRALALYTQYDPAQLSLGDDAQQVLGAIAR